MLSGTIFGDRNRLRCLDANREHGRPKKLYSRSIRMNDFLRFIEGVASGGGEAKVMMFNTTYLQAHRMASRPGVKKAGQCTSAGAC